AFSQTQVSGKVIDEFGSPVPFANIIFVGSTIGTYSDDDGRFSLYAENRYREIEVSYVGFTTKKVRLESNNVSNLTVILPEGEELTEVVIVGKPKVALSKKENPAYPILQGIWKNKKKKGIENTTAFQYKKHSTIELGLNNLDTVFLQKTLKKEYDTIRKILSEKKYKETFSMPLFLSETIENVYGNNELGKIRTDIEAQRTQGVVEKGFGLERVSRTFDDFDIYSNSYIILNRPFVSPLSEFGYSMYHYVLNDSVVENDRTFYKVYFFPKEDQDLALEGSFSVDEKTYIVRSIDMKTTAKTNINLVRGLYFEKHFTIVNDSVYLPERELYEGDFTAISKKEDEKGLYIRNANEYTNFVLNQPKQPIFYDEKVVQTYKNQFARNDSYWKENELSSDRLTKTKSLIQEIGDNNRIRYITDIADIMGTGYIRVNKFLQYGSFWETFASNEVEGNRVRAGFRTFTSTEDRFRSYFYGAYGTKDQELKYGISAKYLVLHQPRLTFGLAYQNDNLQLGSVLLHDDANLDFVNPSNFMFARGENYYLTRNRKIHGVASINFNKNLQFSVFGMFQRSKPADSDNFSIGYRSPSTGEELYRFNDFNTGTMLTYTPGRSVHGYGVEQRYGENLFPTYSIKYTRGVEGVIDSKFDYDKIQLFVHQPLTIWKIGALHTTIEAGKVFGTVPLTMLAPTPANQAYSLTPQTFALLDYYDFVTDTYLNGYFEHHFNGFIMNRIPLVKKTRIRSLVFARFAYGTISSKNTRASLSNVVYNAPESLYWEYGFGFENIGLGNFRFIRLDFIWRSDFNDVNGVRNPKFGVRVGIVPIF
ncbi:MAG: DUF5686 family protein, partial [Capnocytophaga sp.]|nr:DUF5686 family protein [Capnocytophaga sp.]